MKRLLLFSLLLVVLGSITFSDYFYDGFNTNWTYEFTNTSQIDYHYNGTHLVVSGNKTDCGTDLDSYVILNSEINLSEDVNVTLYLDLEDTSSGLSGDNISTVSIILEDNNTGNNRLECGFFVNNTGGDYKLYSSNGTSDPLIYPTSMHTGVINVFYNATTKRIRCIDSSGTEVSSTNSNIGGGGYVKLHADVSAEGSSGCGPVNVSFDYINITANFTDTNSRGTFYDGFNTNWTYHSSNISQITRHYNGTHLNIVGNKTNSGPLDSYLMFDNTLNNSEDVNITLHVNLENVSDGSLSGYNRSAVYIMLNNSDNNFAACVLYFASAGYGSSLELRAQRGSTDSYVSLSSTPSSEGNLTLFYNSSSRSVNCSFGGYSTGVNGYMGTYSGDFNMYFGAGLRAGDSDYTFSGMGPVNASFDFININASFAGSSSGGSSGGSGGSGSNPCDSSITSCCNITSSGTYTVSQNISVSASSTCIGIMSSDVVLNLNGHMLNGSGSGVGVRIFHPGSVYSNITLSNGIFVNLTKGIDVGQTVSNLYILNNRILNSSGDGIFVSGVVAHSNLTNNTICYSGESGIDMDNGGATDTRFENNTICNNSDTGITTGVKFSSSYIQSNTIANNTMWDLKYNSGYCDNNIDNNNGTNGLDILFFDDVQNNDSCDLNAFLQEAVPSISNWGENASEIIFCNATNSTIRNLYFNRSNSALHNNGIIIINSYNTTFDNVTSVGNNVGVYVYSSNVNITNSKIDSNSVGLGVHGSETDVYLSDSNFSNNSASIYTESDMSLSGNLFYNSIVGLLAGNGKEVSFLGDNTINSTRYNELFYDLEGRTVCGSDIILQGGAEINTRESTEYWIYDFDNRSQVNYTYNGTHLIVSGVDSCDDPNNVDSNVTLNRTINLSKDVNVTLYLDMENVSSQLSGDNVTLVKVDFEDGDSDEISCGMYLNSSGNYILFTATGESPQNPTQVSTGAGVLRAYYNATNHNLTCSFNGSTVFTNNSNVSGSGEFFFSVSAHDCGPVNVSFDYINLTNGDLTVNDPFESDEVVLLHVLHLGGLNVIGSAENVTISLVNITNISGTDYTDVDNIYYGTMLISHNGSVLTSNGGYYGLNITPSSSSSSGDVLLALSYDDYDTNYTPKSAYTASAGDWHLLDEVTSVQFPSNYVSLNQTIRSFAYYAPFEYIFATSSGGSSSTTTVVVTHTSTEKSALYVSSQFGCANGDVIIIVKDKNGNLASGALVTLGDQYKYTDADGLATFGITKTGTYAIHVTYKTLAYTGSAYYKLCTVSNITENSRITMVAPKVWVGSDNCTKYTASVVGGVIEVSADSSKCDVGKANKDNNSIGEDHINAMRELNSASLAVSTATSEGKDTHDASTMLKKALSAFESEDYTLAKSLALKAKTLAQNAFSSSDTKSVNVGKKVAKSGGLGLLGYILVGALILVVAGVAYYVGSTSGRKGRRY